MTRFLLSFCLGLLAGAAFADEVDITTADGWIREVPPGAPVRAGYLSLHNRGDTGVTIVAARSEAFGAIEIHEMVPSADGTMRMRRREQLEVAAGATVELAPGGLHLMLFRPTATLAQGDRMPLTLVLADGGKLMTELEQR